MHHRNCSHCGSGFEVPFRSTKRKSCSDRCRRALMHRGKPHARSDKGIRKSGKWLTVVCGHCGKAIERRLDRIEKNKRLGWQHYCSYQCRNVGTKGNSGRPTSRGGEGQRNITEEGYVRVYAKPEERPPDWSSSSVLEHRLVMARRLKRNLLPNETVHHVDGDKTNNAPENLQLRIGRHGRGSHYRCRACGSTDIEAVSFKES